MKILRTVNAGGNFGPEGCFSVGADTKAVPAGILQHPIALVIGVETGSRQVDTDDQVIAGDNTFGQRNTLRTAQRVAVVKDQGISVTPGAGTRIEKAPGLGEGIAQLDDGAIRNGDIVLKSSPVAGDD